MCAGLAPFYEHLCTELGWTPDQAKLTEMQGANLKQLEELEAKIKASDSSRSSSMVLRVQTQGQHSRQQRGFQGLFMQPCASNMHSGTSSGAPHAQQQQGLKLLARGSSYTWVQC